MNTIKFLLVSLLVSALVVLVANLFGEKSATLVGNLLYVPIAGTFVVVAVWVFSQFGLVGTYGKAWLFFVIFAVLWFMAEMIWAFYDLVLETNPYPSISDAFWLAGYPFIFIFLLLYLKPFRKSISKKIISISVIIPLILIGVTIFVTLEVEKENQFFLFLLTVSYPILDALILIPAIIGIILFLKGEINVLWSLISVGILSVALADIGFFVTQYNYTYYTGHPIEIFFYWSYIFYIFGAYTHLKIFRIQEKKD